MALRARIAALETAAHKAEEEHLSHGELRIHRALARASHAELAALSRYQEEDGVDSLAFLRLWEEVLGRESPVLAADVRVRRDLLHRELEALEEQWRAEGRHHSTAYSDPQFWNLSNARVNRMHGLQWFGAPVVEDEGEVMRIIEEILEPQTDTQRILSIVGRTWREE